MGMAKPSLVTISPLYFPVGLSLVMVMLTATFLVYASDRARSQQSFRRAWLLWLIITFYGGFAALTVGVYFALGTGYKGSELCAFVLLMAFSALVVPAFAGIGAFA